MISKITVHLSHAATFCFGVLLLGCKKPVQVDRGHTPIEPEGGRPNILLITPDDMGFNTTGGESCPVPDITPNIDGLAKQGTLFTHGYVMTPQPELSAD